MRLPITTEQFPDPEQLNRYLREIRAAVEAVPGVRETAYSCAPPMQGTCYGMPMQVASRPMVDLANRDGGFFKVVSPSYFSTLGIKPLKGRALSDRDTSNSPPVLVMNERLAKRYFPRRGSDRPAHPDPGDRPRQDRARTGRLVGGRRRHRRREDRRADRRPLCRRLRLERAESGLRNGAERSRRT